MQKWKGDVIFLLVVGALIAGWMYLYPKPGASLLTPLDPPTELQAARTQPTSAWAPGDTGDELVPTDAQPTSAWAPDLPSYASPEGLKLSYRLFEPAGDPNCVLVLLHDTLLHGGWYTNLGRDLAAQGVAVYLPDRRGWGLSAGDRQEVARDRDVLTHDITAMIVTAQARYPQKKVFLGGHGRGAGLVLRYVAAGRPLPGVILISPYITDDQPNLRPEGWQAFARAHPGEAFLARSGLAHWPVWRYNWPGAMIEADPLIESRCSISCQQETMPDDPAAAYGALTVPLLYMQGEADPLLDVDQTAAEIARFATKDITVETCPNTDYLTVLEVAAAPIANWLESK